MSDREPRWVLWGVLGIQSPVLWDWGQARLRLGITSPRHRYLLKQRLGWFGRWLPDKEWQEVNGHPRLVSVGGWKSWR